MPNPTNKFIKTEVPQKADNTLADNMKMVLEKHKRQNNQPIDKNSKILDDRSKKPSNDQHEVLHPIMMGSALYGKISSACKAAAKRKFKVWPSAYASGWGVRCTKAGGPSKFGGGKKK